MNARILTLTAAGFAALTLAGCNPPADEAETGATSVQGAAADGMMTAEGGAVTSGDAPAKAATGSTGSASSGGTTGGGAARSSGAASTGGTAATGGTMTPSAQVESDIPTDARSRQTREVQAAAGTETGQVVPYAYSPTNPKHDAKH